MSIEEAVNASKAFEAAFIEKLNAVIDTERNPDGTMPLFKTIGLCHVLLHVSGFMEGLAHANAEAFESVRGRCVPRSRLTTEEVYAGYTLGFNHAVNITDSQRTVFLAHAEKMLQEGRLA